MNQDPQKGLCERPEPVDSPPDSRPVGINPDQKPKDDDGNPIMHMEIDYLPSSVKVGDRIGSVLEEDSDGKHKWYDCIYTGNNSFRLEPRDKHQSEHIFHENPAIQKDRT